MPTYATADDLRAYAQDFPVAIPEDDELADRLLVRAQYDVDVLCGPWPILSTGLKFDPPTLPVTAREALRRATCVQACFLEAMGGEAALGTDDGIAALHGIAFRGGPLPRVSPLTIEALSGHGLLLHSGTLPPLLDESA